MRILFGLLGGAFVLVVGAAATADPPRFEPVASVRQLMDAVIIPASDAVFDAGTEPPKNEKDWVALEHRILMLAEAGNLLMMEGRAKDTEEWIVRSRELVDVAKRALKAVEGRSGDAILEVGDQLIEVCQHCHNRYLSPSR